MPDKRKVLQWDDETSYIFHVDHPFVEGVCKCVYAGYFVNSAPEGVRPFEPCCLKVITAYPNNSEYADRPQGRERYDLVDFRGGHLRSSLARSQTAQRVVQSLRSSGDCTKTSQCYSVEPLYSLLPERNPKQIDRLQPRERLEYLHQFTLGLLELYARENALGGRQIIAHRDAKIGNGLIRRSRDSFRVQIDDFATIRFSDEDQHSNTSVGKRSLTQPCAAGTICADSRNPGTFPVPLSAENTAPEDLAPHIYPMTTKVDVYAMGTMIASLFGYAQNSEYRNPGSALWLTFYSAWNASQEREITEGLTQTFHAWADAERRGLTAPGRSWLEQALEEAGKPFVWGKQGSDGCDIPIDVLRGILELFYDCTRVHPEDRIDMETLSHRLGELKEHPALSRESSRSPYLYLLPTSTFLYDLRTVRSEKIAYQVSTSQALLHSPVPVNCMVYGSPGVRFSGGSPAASSMYTGFDSRAITRFLEKQTSTAHASLTEALYNLYTYCAYRPEGSSHPLHLDGFFGGEIHIFTTEELTDADLPAIGEVTCPQVLEVLEAKCRENGMEELNLIIHSPHKPRLTRSDWFHWEPIVSSLLIRTPAAGAAPAAGEATSAIPSGQDAEPSQAPVPSIRDEYVTNADALCVVQDGTVIFVSRKIRKR